MSAGAKELAPWVTRLKVKEAKAILKAKSIECTDIVEKRHLLKLVAKNVESEAEATKLLSPSQTSVGEAGKDRKGEPGQASGKDQTENVAGSVPFWPGKDLKLRASMLTWYDDFIAGACFILLVVWITMDDWVPMVCGSENWSKLFRFSTEFCTDFIKTRGLDEIPTASNSESSAS